MAYPMHSQQNILDNVVNQNAVSNLLANYRPNHRNDSPQ